ncbi:MAG TPA: hypothetical protein VHE35_32305 [Kofleriaceae bacterium]|nr:hypothetical protein [Kofleriaceae bacterium]
MRRAAGLTLFVVATLAGGRVARADQTVHLNWLDVDLTIPDGWSVVPDPTGDVIFDGSTFRLTTGLRSHRTCPTVRGAPPAFTCPAGFACAGGPSATAGLVEWDAYAPVYEGNGCLAVVMLMGADRVTAAAHDIPGALQELLDQVNAGHVSTVAARLDRGHLSIAPRIRTGSAATEWTAEALDRAAPEAGGGAYFHPVPDDGRGIAVGRREECPAPPSDSPWPSAAEVDHTDGTITVCARAEHGAWSFVVHVPAGESRAETLAWAVPAVASMIEELAGAPVDPFAPISDDEVFARGVYARAYLAGGLLAPEVSDADTLKLGRVGFDLAVAAPTRRLGLAFAIGASLGSDSGVHADLDTYLGVGMGYTRSRFTLQADALVGANRTGADSANTHGYRGYYGGGVFARVPVGPLALDGAFLATRSPRITERRLVAGVARSGFVGGLQLDDDQQGTEVLVFVGLAPPYGDEAASRARIEHNQELNAGSP